MGATDWLQTGCTGSGLLMHRDLEMTVASAATDGLLADLKGMAGVISVAVQREASVKPPGDVISAAVLNTDVDAVLSLVETAEKHGPISVSTSGLDSLIDSENQDAVRGDVDEASWEEAETAMRRHSRLTANFFLTTAGGAIIVTCGLAASSGVTEAIALVAAAVIAPVFEPLARIGLGVVNRHPRVVTHGITSALLSYVTLIVVSVLTMLVLRTGGHGFVDEFLRSPTVHEVQYPPLINLILSAVGAVTGVVMISAGRFTQLAGPLVALQLLPAAATLGVALELGDGGIAARSLGRLSIDVGMVILAGLIVFAYKHAAVHGHRRPPH
jgi:uncharacterized membrane protein